MGDKETKKVLFPLLLFSMLIFLSSCATTPSSGPYQEKETADIQKKLLLSAEHYTGTTSGMLEAGDRNYCLDCSGAILAIYYRAGIDLEKCYTEYEGNGVKRLYSCLRDNKLILNKTIPQIGDLIFWDNTWDRNEDKKFNDYFTHTGMVVDVARDGTITYVHHNYRKGIIYEKMNLEHPHDPEYNSPMRMKGSPPAPNGQWLASELVRVFGRAWELPERYWR